MNTFRSITCLFLFFCSSIAIIGCSSDIPTFPDHPEGIWRYEGLGGTIINRLYHHGGKLYAANESGVYRREVERSINSWGWPENWDEMGLKPEKTHGVTDLIIWDHQEILASIAHHPEQYDPETPVLYMTQNEGANWIPFTDQIIGEEYANVINRLAKNSVRPDEIYAMRQDGIARSLDRGRNWKMVRDGWNNLGAGRFLRVSDTHPDFILSGGTASIPSPFLNISRDGGDNWERLSNSLAPNFEANCYDGLIHPSNADLIMAGLSGGIRASRDGGKTFETVYTGAHIYSLEHGALQPEITYASGRRPDGILFFEITEDFGESWRVITNPDAGSEFGIRDLVPIESEGREIVFLATNTGLYSFTFDS